MRTTLAALVFVFVAVLSVPDRAAAQTPLFLLDTDEATFVTLFRVDPVTGELTLLGSLPTDLGPIASLAAASENQLYAVAQGGDVLEITVSPFGVTSIGNVGANLVTGAAFFDGGLYAIDEGTSSLYRIGLAPVAQTLVGEVRFADGSPLAIGGGDLARDALGNWYLWTNTTRALYRLDVATATVTADPAQVVDLEFTTGLAFDYESAPDVPIGSGRDTDSLRELDPATGQDLSAVALCLGCPAPFDHTFGDLASAEPERLCTRGKGFWRRHPRLWPVTSLVLGNQTYSRLALLVLLRVPVHGDASVNLAHQLIAAKLNVASGSASAPVAATIAQADGQLGAFPGRLPLRVRPNTPAGRAMVETARVLAEYNEGGLTALCVR
jgi:hypothetical protein